MRPCSRFTLIAWALSGSTMALAQVDHEVLVNSRNTHAVFHYDLIGNHLGEFIAAGSGGLFGPEDIFFHPDGSILVTGFGNTAIKRYDGSTGAFLGDFSSGYALATPSKMSMGPDSLLYVTQWGATQNKVVRFDLVGAFVDEFTSIGTPNGLGHFWDATGRFYISVYGNGATGTVQRFAADGTFLDIFIDSSILQGPTDLWQEANGDVLVEDWTTGTVLRFDSTGAFLSTYISGLSNPEGHAFLPNGDLLIGDWGEDAVHWFDASGTSLGYFTSGNGLADPNCVRVREVPFSGVGEHSPGTDALHVVPTVGAGPFDLGLGEGIDRHMRLRVLDATGRVVDSAPLHELLERNGHARWDPDESLPAGGYHLVVDGAQTLSHAWVVVTR